MRQNAVFGSVLLLAILFLPACRQSGLVQPVAELQQVDTTAAGYRLQIQQLSAQIRQYETDVRRLAGQRGQLGVLLKLLTVVYLERGMYADALDSLQEARGIDPENPVLFYYTGVASARLATVNPPGAGRSQLFADAEWAYRQALARDQDYSEALYGLSVLLIHELNRPQEAQPLLERLLATETRHIDGMFLQAAMYVRTDRPSQAIAVYRRIEQTSQDPDRRQRAAQNRIELERAP